LQKQYKLEIIGGNMKTLIYIFLIITVSFCLIYFSSNLNKNSKVFAASTNSASDLQLIARAINRRSKRRAI